MSPTWTTSDPPRRRWWSFLRGGVDRLRRTSASRGRPVALPALGVTLAIVAGLLLALAVRAYDAPDRIVIGNTAGTLSVLIEVDGVRMLVGAGSTRSHAADFVGRSTRPWDRHIDLLILPGWDERHVTGAIGLLERQEVSGIVIVGLPGEHPMWTVLEREAQWRDIDIRHLDGTHRLDIAEHTIVTFYAPQESDMSEGASLIRLDYHATRIDVIDAERDTQRTRELAQDGARDAPIAILARSQRHAVPTGATLTVRPEPFLAQEFQPTDGRYTVDVARNDRVVLTLSPSSIRVPLDRVNDAE